MKHTYRWITLIVGIVLCGVVYFIADSTQKIKDATASDFTETVKEDFSQEHYNLIKVDTFVKIIQQAYQPYIKVEQSNQQVRVAMQGANQLTKDFFNGNDALLEISKRKFGFKINYDPNNQSLEATFDVDANNCVPVPNDVLIKVADKLYNK